METKYDVALSFAGEDRYYVKEVAEILRDSGMQVFYDEFEESNLWGKNLYTYLRDVYRDQARYTIMFCSENYSKKLWTNHERESAQERAFKESSEYILPAKLDDTEIPGLPKTVAYIDLRQKTPYEFCLIIAKKLNVNIIKKEKINRNLHGAVNKIIEEEDNLSLVELENRNKYWDNYESHMKSLNRKERFIYQKMNTIFYLDKYGLSVQEIKKHLRSLGYYDGNINNEFTEDFALSIEKFQNLNNMRHIDGMIGELTLEKIEDKLRTKLTRK